MIENGGLFSSSAGSSAAGPFSMLLLLVAIVIWSSHSISHRLSFLTEGSLALLSGLAAGGGFYFYFEKVKGVHIPYELVAFNYDIYMSLLLPPIIFYAGFSIKKKHFFSNIGALATLGIAGTILLAALLAIILATALHTVGLDTHNIVGNALALGVIFSSTDSVAALQAIDGGIYPQLHALVFGEAVVNDATAIVLLKAVQNIRKEEQLTLTALALILKSFLQLSVLSMILGIIVGLISAFILKHSFGTRHSTDHEVSLLAALGFLSYILAEWCNLSGVFSTFFCGLTMSHYAWHSLSPSAKVASVHAFRVLSFLAELLMFLSCGLDLWETKLWHKDILSKKRSMKKMFALVCWISVSIPIARFAVALPLLAVVNKLRKPGQSISWKNRMAVSWAGCARGAVTLALAVNHFLGSDETGKEKKVEDSEENRIIAAAAMMVIVFSTVVLGGATPAIFTRLLREDSPELKEKRTGVSTTTTETDRNRGSDGYLPGGVGKPGVSSNRIPFGSQSLTVPLLSVPPSSTGNGTAITPTTATAIATGTSAFRENEDEQGDVLGKSLHAKWTTLDKRVFQPLFGGRSLSFRHHDSDADGGAGGAGGGGGGGGGADFNIVVGQERDAAVNPVFLRPSPYESKQRRSQDGNRERQQQAAGALADIETGGPSAALPSPLLGTRLKSAQSFSKPVNEDVLEELFSQPGRSRRGPEVDREIEEDGLVLEAEECLEN